MGETPKTALPPQDRAASLARVLILGGIVGAQWLRPHEL